MGCNCGKNRRTAAQAKAEQSAAPAPLNQNQRNTTGQTTSTPAPKGTTQSFALNLRDGRTMKFGSRLEAEAENVRQGYTGTVKPI